MSAKKRRFPWLISVLALLVLGIGGWFGFKTFSKPETASYQTTAVTRGNLETSISAAGKVQPKETVDVGAQVSGQLESLLVEAGDQVEEGQLLARIDATLAQTQVDSQRAQLKELKASRLQQEASLRLKQSQAKRAAMLYDADAISQADFETSESELSVAEAQLAGIDAQIERQTSTLAADLAELEFTNIYAPVSGTVVELSASEGQTLNANQTAPTILTIADLTIMTVETDVSEADVLSVGNGQEAYFSTLGNSDRKWETTVRQILPTPEVVNDVVLYKALLDVANPDGLLRTEMTTQVFFLTGKAENALLVPITALQAATPRRARGNSATPDTDRESTGADTGQQPRSPERESRMAGMKTALEANPGATRGMVLVMTASGEPRPQPVIVGLRTRTQAEILFGLDENDIVVTSTVNPSDIARPSGGERRGPPPGGFRPR
jgi:macrolide-specific efflux system membrane fusion protein